MSRRKKIAPVMAVTVTRAETPSGAPWGGANTVNPLEDPSTLRRRPAAAVPPLGGCPLGVMGATAAASPSGDVACIPYLNRDTLSTHSSTTAPNNSIDFTPRLDLLRDPQKHAVGASLRYRLVTSRGFSELRRVYVPNQAPPRGEPSANIIEKANSSYRRAIRRLFDLALANDWQWWFTLTVAPRPGRDRHSIDELKKHWHNVNQAARRQGIHLSYIVVPEPHKDGSWHMHGLLNGLPRSELHTNANGKLEWSVASSIGFHSLIPFDGQERIGCAKYMCKYISKDWGKRLEFGVMPGDRLFWPSKGLSEPEVIDLDPRQIKPEVLRGLERAEDIRQGKEVCPWSEEDELPWKLLGKHSAVCRLPDGLPDPSSYVVRDGLDLRVPSLSPAESARIDEAWDDLEDNL